MQPSREGGTSPSGSSLFPGMEGPPGRRRDGGRQPWRRLFTDRGITAAVAEGEKRRQQGCDGVIGLPLSQLGKRERGQKRHGGKREEAGKRCVRWEERESGGGGQCFEEGMDKTRVQMRREVGKRKAGLLFVLRTRDERGMNVSGVFKALKLY